MSAELGTVKVSAPVSSTDKVITFEAGKLAQLAGGSVVGRIGDTVVLVAATASKKVREGTDFFPLTVDIEERMYAAGKIPGSFFRREGKASDQAVLTARLTDRPLRPSFPEGFRNDVHVVGTIMAADLINPHDVLTINTASAALMVSDIPFDGPIGAVRVAYSTSGQWIANPTFEEGDDATFELIVAGRELGDDDVAIMMVEAGGTEDAWQYYQEGAPKVTEDVIAQGLEASKTWIRESCIAQKELVKQFGAKPTMAFEAQLDYSDEMYTAVESVGGAAFDTATQIGDKTERLAAIENATDSVMMALAEKYEGQEKEIKAAVKSLQKKLIRRRIVQDGVRIDGRGVSDLRPLSAEVGILPTAHGSGLFQRGETQVLNVTTLGMPRMEQMLDTITTDEKKRYMHHYNFPAFSTGEPGRMMGPKRREIGHGLLAERALLPVVPPLDEFPYALRLVSDVLASNGSTSMASVCGSTLSMMDAGVPLRAPVAGIAMGLVYAEGKYTTLTDILGAEDAFGDMDFKVAGTSDFVTALQLDTKIDGIPADVLGAALKQAYEARTKILEVMKGAIAEPRSEVQGTAPKIVSFEIPIDKIGEIIGPKGKVINAIQQETGADIAVDDDGMVGTVSIASKDSSIVDEARRRVEMILDPPRAEVGAVYMGRVVNVTKFGAFVNILPGRDGLVHISKLGAGKRIERVEDVLNLGDSIEVRVDDIDPQGKVNLTPANAVAAPEKASRPAPSSSSSSTSGDAAPAASGTERVSFEETWSAEASSEFGIAPGAPESEDRPRRNPRRR